jgi:hypothetical protein
VIGSEKYDSCIVIGADERLVLQLNIDGSTGMRR